MLSRYHTTHTEHKYNSSIGWPKLVIEVRLDWKVGAGMQGWVKLTDISICFLQSVTVRRWLGITPKSPPCKKASLQKASSKRPPLKRPLQKGFIFEKRPPHSIFLFSLYFHDFKMKNIFLHLTFFSFYIVFHFFLILLRVSFWRKIQLQNKNVNIFINSYLKSSQ